MAARHAIATALALMLAASPAAAQEHDLTLSAAAGVSLRGAGDLNACCGPYQADVERFRTPWIGGSLSKPVASRFSIGGEFTWMREPAYKAYVQGKILDDAVRLYAAENRITTWTAAGLARLHAWNTDATRVDLVAGAGVARAHRSSALRSGVLRPGPPPGEPVLSGDTSDGRSRLLALAGIDVSVLQGRMIYGITTRLMMMRTGESVRTDLEPGGTLLRLGASVGARF